MSKREIRRQKKLRNKMKLRRRNLSLMIAFAVVVIIFFSVQSVSLQQKVKDYKAQEQELQQSIESEKQNAKEIDELESRVGTDEYIEEIAREKLGLVFKDEIIFKAE